MDHAAAEELRQCAAATAIEAARDLPKGAWRPNAEALQMALWRHREAILQLIDEREATDQVLSEVVATLRPFARVTELLKPGQNQVLFSIPTIDGRGFVQLRPADFRRASALLGQRRLSILLSNLSAEAA